MKIKSSLIISASLVATPKVIKFFTSGIKDSSIKAIGMYINIYVLLIGMLLILLGKVLISIKKDINLQESNDLGNLNIFSCYIASELFAKINFRYGKKLSLCGLLGILTYEEWGLFITILTILIILSYLVSIFINGYRYCFLSR